MTDTNTRAMLKRLDAISEDNGAPYGRVHEPFEAEQTYGLQIAKFQGYLRFSNAFK